MAKRPLITYSHGRKSASKRGRWVDLTTDDDDFISASIDMGFVPNTLSNDKLIPTRPTSQAAAMASEPSDESIGNVVAFTGCTPSVATRALRVKNNNVDAAMNAVLDNEDLEKLERDLGWNEGLMSNVQPFGASAAPTRGNSPVGSMQPNTQDEADHQMAAALAASQQETGVVTADGTNMIGPSNRNDPSNQWAMVLHGAQEVLGDAEIGKRVQEKDAVEPRLLKHLTDGDYTPNFLTICHEIPAAREALLLKSWVKDEYGYDEGWWRGQPIPTPTVVHVADGSSAATPTDKQEELIAELQRLMVFLGHSDRIYASTGGLTETKMIKEHNLSDGSLLELVLKSWTAAAANKNPAVSDMFTTKMGTNSKEGMDTPYMPVAEITVLSDQSSKKYLSELLDDLIWSQDLADDNYMERPADVLIINLKQADPEMKQLNVDVPASFYMDKYLEENLESSRILRRDMMQARHKLERVEAVEKKLTTWSFRDSKKAEKEAAKLEQGAKGKDQVGSKESAKVSHPVIGEDNAEIKVKDLFAHSIAHFSGENREEADASDTPLQPDLPEFPEIAAKLERVMLNIEFKLRELAVLKEKTRSMLSDLSKSTPSTKHQYTLRGVATKPSITYVLSAKPSPDVEMVGQAATKLVDVDDNTPAGMQWWRLAYESSGSNAAIRRTPAADYDVLRAVELEHTSALLVYASDRAIAPIPDSFSDIPEPLKQFITRDNHQANLELTAARRPNPDFTYFDQVRDSIEPPDSRRGSDSSLNVNGRPSPSPPSPPVDEIFLDPPEEDSAGVVEMAQTEHSKPLTLGDTAMGGLSESQGAGAEGGEHVEDADIKMAE
ncbi:uncharacterized protein RCC_07310 [Ramularia collo-cygni]|uniref:Ubiquitin interaction motif protein n=1 Tax=Ramularia collo-cygni TaxID=112498 RepID=A0A2D3V9K8_9PEZI|nr:uncharacterized protein RCC_07310 [Ramularia collo-cygni]CZT21447.1 uncharacterized protein RCC_07310 [Ramularia collo-cygni]